MTPAAGCLSLKPPALPLSHQEGLQQGKITVSMLIITINDLNLNDDHHLDHNVHVDHHAHHNDHDDDLQLDHDGDHFVTQSR